MFPKKKTCRTLQALKPVRLLKSAGWCSPKQGTKDQESTEQTARIDWPFTRSGEDSIWVLVRWWIPHRPMRRRCRWGCTLVGAGRTRRRWRSSAARSYSPRSSAFSAVIGARHSINPIRRPWSWPRAQSDPCLTDVGPHGSCLLAIWPEEKSTDG